MKTAIIHNLFLALALLSIVGMAQAEALYERSFAEMGFEDFWAEGAQQSKCTDIAFVLPSEVNALEEGIYPIHSLAVQFLPVQEGTADVNVFLNSEHLALLTVDDFKCSGESCWERLPLPKELLQQEKGNTLLVCLRTSDSITKVGLLNRSMVGLYRTADFEAEDAFGVSAEKTRLVIGEKTEIKISLHNRGSTSAYAEVRHARPLAEDKRAFVVVEGSAQARGFVLPGESMEIRYVLKPRVASTMTLPPAIVYYKNEFGEEEQRFSNLVTLNVREPEVKIEAFVVKQKEADEVGKPIELQLAVRNVGMDPLYDLGVELHLPEQLQMLRRPGTEISSVMPKETEYLQFSVVSNAAGKFAIGCTVSSVDLNLNESKCLDSSVSFRHREISPTVFAGVALVVLAVMVYLYLRFGS